MEIEIEIEIEISIEIEIEIEMEIYIYISCNICLKDPKSMGSVVIFLIMGNAGFRSSAVVVAV